MADKKADEYLGGQAGIAADRLRGRQKQLDDAERVGNGESPKESPNRQPDNSSGGVRPPQSKKWYE